MIGARGGHSARLSALDAAFVSMESPQAHMHVACSAIVTVRPGVPRPTLAALRARIADRLHWQARLRQRLQQAPLGLWEPRWIDDPSFDLRDHVVALTEPGTAVSMEEFAALRDALLSEPLARDHPLWQVALVPQLRDGRAALVGRVHHAMADGLAALGLAALLLDGDGDGSDEDRCAWEARPAPRAATYVLDHLLDPARLTARAVGQAARSASHPDASARRASRCAGRLVRGLREDVLPAAPASPLNVALGGRRTLHTHRLAKAELYAAGGTLNDVGLALVAGALRRLTLELGQPAHSLKAMIPVNVRGAHEYGVLGNRLSMTTVRLPLHLESAPARLSWVREQTERFKRSGRAAGNQALIPTLGLLQGPLRQAVLRAGASRAYNLVVSSVPGPRTALHVLGARLDEIYPVVPIGPRHALAIGMLAYDRCVHFGLHAEPDALPQAALLPDMLADELDTLRGAASPHGARIAELSTVRRQTILRRAGAPVGQ